jgi:hypothetical protein
MILNPASFQDFFTTVFNGIDIWWRFPANSIVITLYGYRHLPYSAYQYPHWAFSYTVATFYGRYLKDRNTETVFVVVS